MEKFSVILPVHGNADFLEQTLDSINKSVVLPYAVLLIDDNFSQEIKSRVTSKKYNFDLKILPNLGSGLVDALNTGIDLSETELVARIDSDDLVCPNRFNAQVSYMSENSRVVAVGGQVTYITENGDELGTSNYPVGRIDNLRKFKNACLLAHPSVMMRTNAIKHVGKYRKIAMSGDSVLSEDFDLWLRMASEGELHNLDEVLIHYRQHNGQLSSIHSNVQTISTIYVSCINRSKYKNEIAPLQIVGNRIENLKKILIILWNGGGVLTLAIFSFEFLKISEKIRHKFFKRLIHLIGATLKKIYDFAG